MSPLRIPAATYRLQFHKEFRFTDAAAMVEYLDRLGITDMYASPLLTARPGSRHGYDVIDHSQLNPEIGTPDEFVLLSDRLRQQGMGLIVDVVPNHMEIDHPGNHWWQNVLENGPSSPFAHYFDIDWNPPKTSLRNRVLLPVLGDQYGRVLEAGEIQLAYASGAFYVTYYDRMFPVDPRTYPTVLDLALAQVRYVTEPTDLDRIELESIVTGLGYLPERTEGSAERIEERQREKEVAKRRLDELVRRSGPVERAIESAVDELNGRHGESESFDRLEELLAGQAWRLCYWRVAADEINYRRFFDVDDLAAIRVEEPEVFTAVHQVMLDLIGQGRITGLRVDHPDGLLDPEHYFLRLQAEGRRAMTGGELQLPSLPLKGLDCPLYIVAEKILCPGEQLPERWSVHGTTGYEMLNLINGVFIDPAAAADLQRLFMRHGGRFPDFREFIYEGKKLILDVAMPSELHVLARRLDRVSEQHRWSRDFTFWSLHKALAEMVACFRVYRTYVQAETNEPSEEDRQHVEQATRAAKRRNPAMDPSIFDFIGSLMLLETPEGLTERERQQRRDLVLRIQQLTGPVMAKGVEDTAFYRAFPLASQNEVGGEPTEFAVSLEHLHEVCAARRNQFPYGMIASSTHDTKRSEDVRARLNVLSEIPQLWEQTITRWQQINHQRRALIEGLLVPDANEEYLLYQTLVGAWPLENPDDAAHAEFVERISQYMGKALKEAKRHTSWINPNEEYEQAVSRFVRAVLDRDSAGDFLDDLTEFCRRIEYPGMCNGLSQLLLKITLPGVPDFYQGTELWNLRLVDPDNRGVIDFAQRSKLLADLDRREREDRGGLLSDLHQHWRNGSIKLWTASRALRLRRETGDLFTTGEYLAPTASGEQQEQVVSVLRRQPGMAALAIAPRWITKLPPQGETALGKPAWGDTTVQLPEDAPRHWRDALSGRTYAIGAERSLPMAQLLEQLPVALLVATDA